MIPESPISRDTIVDFINTFKQANIVLKLALIANAILTFMFGFTYLAELFDLFGLLDAGTTAYVIRALAGFFTTVVFDGAFYAWSFMRLLRGNTTAQMAVAKRAKNMSLYGSLAASAGQFVLQQTAVNLAAGLVFAISLSATVAVAAIALMHMKWWSEYNESSEEAVARAQAATDRAEEIDRRRKEQQDMQALDVKKKEDAHALRMQELNNAHELEVARITADAELKKKIHEQKLQHRREVFNRSSELVKKQMHKISQELADKEAQAIVDDILIEYGRDPHSFPVPAQPNGVPHNGTDRGSG